MSKYLVDYELSIKVKNRILLGTIIGDRGMNKEYIEKITKTKLKIVDDKIFITGDRNSVLKADAVIFETITAHNFTAELMNECTGKIVGLKGTNLQRIERITNARIEMTRMNTHSSQMEITGNHKSFKHALIQVIDTIHSHVQDQFKTENSTRCYRSKGIDEGSSKVDYIVDQLPPSPQTVFLQFKTELNEGEELYVPREMDTSKIPPDYVGRNSAVLAPYKGYLYRAKILSVHGADRKDDILLNVKFVDFGNILTVSYFQCKTLLSVFLYPPYATACQVMNIKQVVWTKPALKKFRTHMNDHTGTVLVKTQRTFNSDELVFVKLLVEEVGDIGDLLIDNDLADEIDGPFIPRWKPSPNQNRLGFMEMLFEADGLGGSVGICVSSYARPREDLQDFTHTSNFAYNSILDSIKTAYACASKFLNDQNCDYLVNNKLHFSANTRRRFSGKSFGASLTITILSECLKKTIPQDIALTGAIAGHGDIMAVGSLQEKLLAAHNHGKKVFYVPSDNYIEAIEMKTDIFVKPVSNIFSLVNEIWE